MPVAPATTGRAAASLWVFASTIGEVHAIEPFLDRLRCELGDPPLTLISDRNIYGDAYRAKFPQAQLEQLDGSTAQVRSLVQRHPPLMLLVAEIPSLLHDAPCRLSYATQHAARQAGAPVVLVNGWLYGYSPPSRMDRIENRWFARDYAAGFDLALVQTDAVRQGLITAGADPARVKVTGNIKFDAMASTSAVTSMPLHQALAARQRALILVAGSVTEIDHQREVVGAFRRVLAIQQGALLVLAPRHPENQPRMEALRALLQTTGLDCRWRSAHDPAEAVAGDVLVLDTVGELRGCYARADAAFVGIDHNVLEPLAFGTPVFVSDGWNATYPSYPVYRQLMDAQVLHSVGGLSNLGDAWIRHFQQLVPNCAAVKRRLANVLALACGAAERNIQAMKSHDLLDVQRGN